MKADLEQINKQCGIGDKILINLFKFQKYCTAIHLALNKGSNQVESNFIYLLPIHIKSCLMTVVEEI